MVNTNLLTLQTNLGYSFRQSWLLLQALTHRSYAIEHNERLEFLGDTVLNLAITQILFIRYPANSEGDLSRLRSRLVCQDMLHQIALVLNLSNCMRLGEGELHSGGQIRPSIMADMLESILGAIFLDSNYDTVVKIINNLYQEYLANFKPGIQQKDAKSQLQELLQAQQFSVPDYTVINIFGAQHAQSFEVLCTVKAWNLQATGMGVSRKLAEQIAADQVLNVYLKKQTISMNAHKINKNIKHKINNSKKNKVKK